MNYLETKGNTEIDQTDSALFRLGNDSRENFYKQFQALKSVLLTDGVKVGRPIGEKTDKVDLCTGN